MSKVKLNEEQKEILSTKTRNVTKGTALTQQEYKQIKAFKGSGMSQAQIATLFNRSGSVVSNVFRSENLAEMKAKDLERRAKYEKVSTKQEEPTVPEPVIEPVVEPVPEVVEVKELLERLTIGVERLADAWENTPKRKFF